MRYRLAWLLALATPLCAQVGPYPKPPPGQAEYEGIPTDAVAGDSERFVAWAQVVETLTYGESISDTWKRPERALGAAVGPAPADDPYHDGDFESQTGGVFEVCPIGRGGEITFYFSRPLVDGPGADFAVFENGYVDTFLELAFVEVSTDGIHFVRFPAISLNEDLDPDPERVDAILDARNLHNLAGKYRIGFGTPFDLTELAGQLDTNSVRYVRLVDIPGDGSVADSQGNPIYDVYPTSVTAGFDVDGVGVLNERLPYLKLGEIFVYANAVLINWDGEMGATYTTERSADLTGWAVEETLRLDAAEQSSAGPLPASEALFFRIVR